MKSYSSSFILLVFAIITFGCNRTPEQPAVDAGQQTADRDSIKENEEVKFPTAFNAADVSAAADVWADDGIWMLPEVPADVGKEAIRARLQEWFDQTSYENAKQVVEEVEVVGDWAWARGSYSSTETPRAGGESVEVRGKYLIVAKRQPDGSWKTYRACANADHPVPRL
jgi:uncharacterized protein (TIGR02246 family)